MLTFPYGVADFQRIRKTGRVYVDRTAHIRDVESLGDNLLFIRPRRFGKSLWLSTLAAYYDLRTAAAHELLFGQLAIGRDPTPSAHRSFVLLWDFSWVSPSGTVAEIAESLNGYVNTALEGFLSDYREHLPPLTVRESARETFQAILSAIRQTPHPLCLLIDEYDNFANEVMVRDRETYSGLVHGAGPYKELMKTVKAATQGRGLERLFVTGVAPVVMSDLSSGMNILVDVYQRPELNALCGFTEQEIVDLLESIRASAATAPGWTVEEVQPTIRDWYDGYRFSPRSRERVYNPTLVLYFLDHLQRYGEPPHELLDSNLAADEDKLRFVGRATLGQQTVLDVLQKETPLEISQLVSRFTMGDLLDPAAQDRDFIASFLTYFGMLTLAGESSAGLLRLVPPNMVVRKLYFEQALRFLLPPGTERTAAGDHAHELLERGDIAPLLAFVEEKLFPVMSNRDYVFMDEHGLKLIFTTLLWSDATHLVVSEPELGRGYADLCLLRRPDRRMPGVYDLVFEFKYLKLGSLGLSAEQLRQKARGELEALTAVAEALAAAEGQLRRYREALVERYGATLRLRAYAVVSLGFERIVAREIQPPLTP